MRNGHTEKDVTRLLSLPDVPDINDGDIIIISRQAAIDALADMHCKSYGRTMGVNDGTVLHEK